MLARCMQTAPESAEMAPKLQRVKSSAHDALMAAESGTPIRELRRQAAAAALSEIEATSQLNEHASAGSAETVVPTGDVFSASSSAASIKLEDSAHRLVPERSERRRSSVGSERRRSSVSFSLIGDMRQRRPSTMQLTMTKQTPTDVLGIEFAPHDGNGGVSVSNMTPKGLARASGVRGGDLVLAIDGASIANPDDAAELLRGRSGKIVLTVVRGGNISRRNTETCFRPSLEEVSYHADL